MNDPCNEVEAKKYSLCISMAKLPFVTSSSRTSHLRQSQTKKSRRNKGNLSRKNARVVAKLNEFPIPSKSADEGFERCAVSDSRVGAKNIFLA